MEPTERKAVPVKERLADLLEFLHVVAALPTKEFADALRQSRPAVSPSVKEDLQMIAAGIPEDGCAAPFHQECRRGFEFEEDRQKILDQKAGGLAALTGGSMAALLGLAIFIGKERASLSDRMAQVATVAIVIAIFFLAGTALFVLRAWAVREWRGPEERDIFNPTALVNPSLYQRYMGLHYWLLCRFNRDVNDKKARQVSRASIWYQVSLVCILVLVLLVLVLALGGKNAQP